MVKIEEITLKTCTVCGRSVLGSKNKIKHSPDCSHYDADILFEPKSTRTIKGKIVSRERGKFETESLVEG